MLKFISPSNLTSILSDFKTRLLAAADTKDTAVTTAANTYADGKATDALNSAKTYADTKASDTATAANTYADTAATNALNSAKSYADSAISTKLSRQIVDTLPDVATASTSVIYLVAKTTSTGGNMYDEYIVINGAYELLGDAQMDLSGYYTSTQVDDKITAATAEMTADEVTAFDTALWA